MNGGQLINFDTFINYVNDRLGDSSSRAGISKIFEKISDPNLVKY
jgi:hypothetical protein